MFYFIDALAQNRVYPVRAYDANVPRIRRVDTRTQ